MHRITNTQMFVSDTYFIVTTQKKENIVFVVVVGQVTLCSYCKANNKLLFFCAKDFMEEKNYESFCHLQMLLLSVSYVKLYCLLQERKKDDVKNSREYDVNVIWSLIFDYSFLINFIVKDNNTQINFYLPNFYLIINLYKMWRF